MRIAVITDVHANLPALVALLKTIDEQGCDLIYHLGDAIGIGPYPEETLSLLLRTPKMQFVRGNHDGYFVDGIPQPPPSYMSAGEVEHQLWTHDRLNPSQSETVAKWPSMISSSINGIKIIFIHYGMTNETGYVPIVRPITASGLDESFRPQDADLVFFGHDHAASDTQGRARYINPGSAGCQRDARAPYSLIDVNANGCDVKHEWVEYDDRPLFTEFEKRCVPDRQTICRIFFGGRGPFNR